MSGFTAAEAPGPATALIDSDDAKEQHIICECRRFVTYCGRYDENQLDGFADEFTDDELCTTCMEIADTTGCPICGCRNFNLCEACLTNPV